MLNYEHVAMLRHNIHLITERPATLAGEVGNDVSC